MPAASQTEIDAVVAAIKAADPTFELVAFLAQVSARFTSLKQAWAAGDVDRVRPLLGDGLYGQWHAQAAGWQTAGVRNVIDDLHVLATVVLRAAHADGLDRLLVGFEYQAAHYGVAPSGHLLFGSPEPQPYVEFWTFARPSGVKPTSTCPKCGAPLELSPEGLCRYCKASLPPEVVGWVAISVADALDWRGFGT